MRTFELKLTCLLITFYVVSNTVCREYYRKMIYNDLIDDNSQEKIPKRIFSS
eukprot:UN25074